MVEKEKKKFEVVEVATQTTPVIQDNETEERHDLMSIVCQLANDIESVKKAVIGKE